MPTHTASPKASHSQRIFAAFAHEVAASHVPSEFDALAQLPIPWMAELVRQVGLGPMLYAAKGASVAVHTRLHECVTDVREDAMFKSFLKIGRGDPQTVQRARQEVIWTLRYLLGPVPHASIPDTVVRLLRGKGAVEQTSRGHLAFA